MDGLPPQRLLTATELAEFLAKENRKWVVDNAKSLGGMKVGRVWRFDLDDVKAALGKAKKLDPLTPTRLSAARRKNAA